MAHLLEAREKREKTKKRTQDAAEDVRDARFKDNTDDVTFLSALHARLEDAGSLETALTGIELKKMMRAKEFHCHQDRWSSLAFNEQYLHNSAELVAELKTTADVLQTRLDRGESPFKRTSTRRHRDT